MTRPRTLASGGVAMTALAAAAGGATAGAGVSAAGSGGPAAAAPAPPGAAALRRLSARLAPVDLAVDIGGLPPGERAALAALIEAARVMDTLFLRQVWAGNDAVLYQLAGDATPLGRARLEAFVQN